MIRVPQSMIEVLFRELGCLEAFESIEQSQLEQLLSMLGIDEQFLIHWFLFECFPRLKDFFSEYPVVPEEVAEFVHDVVTGFVPPHGGFPFSQKTEVLLGDVRIRVYTFEWLPPPGEEKQWQPYQLIVRLDG